MTQKKKKVSKKNNKALTKKTEEKKLLWLGAQRLMGRPATPQEEREKKMILLTSKVLAVSPFGVNILGNVPYINKLGLMQKAKEYSPAVRFEYMWIRVSENDTDKAVCKCKVKRGNQDMTDWVVGECSPSTIKMGTLKGYQNHMAQTRSRNRAILEAFGDRIHQEMMRNIEKAYNKKLITGKEAEAVGSAVKSSAEEIQPEKRSRPQPTRSVQHKVEGLQASDADRKKITKVATEMGASTHADIVQLIKKKTGFSPSDWNRMTKSQATDILAALLNAQLAQ